MKMSSTVPELLHVDRYSDASKCNLQVLIVNKSRHLKIFCYCLILITLFSLHTL
jgi:hypothetical protein